jgi:hypothetical protein
MSTLLWHWGAMAFLGSKCSIPVMKRTRRVVWR